MVRTVEDLRALDYGQDAVMAQRFMTPDGPDRKIYRIGDEVFCVERVWPPTSYEDKLGRLVELPPAVEAVARACGDALGIDVYGVDVIEHQGEPYVVDLSSFPGFKGVPDAGRRLPDGRSGRRDRRRDLGLAQPAPRQRHQVLLGPRGEAR